MNNYSMTRNHRLRSLKYLSVVVSVFFVIAIVAFVVPNKNLISNVSGATLYVGGGGSGNYSTIQAAIDNASDGDTVFVYYVPWNYNEHILINKSINLIGENYFGMRPIIDGGGDPHVVYVSDVNYFNMSWFEVINSGTGPDWSGIYIISSSNVNISNNKVRDNCYGICIALSSFINVQGNEIYGNLWGIKSSHSSNNTFINNSVHNQIKLGGSGGHGLFFQGSPYYNNKIIGNLVYNNEQDGIHLEDETFWNNSIINNTVYNNRPDGIFIGRGTNNFIIDNIVHHNGLGSINPSAGIRISRTSNNVVRGNTVHDNDNGIYLEKSINNRYTINNTIAGNTVYNNDIGIRVREAQDNTFIENTIFNNKNNVYIERQSWNINFINCSLLNPTYYDFNLTENSHATTLNTTFDDTKIMIEPGSTLTIKNYLHVLVLNATIAPISGADIEVTDNGNPIYQTHIFGGNDPQTGGDGFVRWIAVTDRKYIGSNVAIENITTAEVSYPTKTFTDNPRDVNMSSSHTEIFIEVGAKFIILYEGWNLISIPSIQSDTNLDTVLSSISGSYDAVQWYNVSDNSDPWKHNSTKKPSHLNDLEDIDHTMGFWIHITQPGGILFQYPGIQPIENQSITLHPGWNLVGYPSLISYNRTQGLNNITFGKDVDSIWAYDTLTQKWEELGPSDYFEIGKGYWVHSKVEKDWDVPL